MEYVPRVKNRFVYPMSRMYAPIIALPSSLKFLISNFIFWKQHQIGISGFQDICDLEIENLTFFGKLLITETKDLTI